MVPDIRQVLNKWYLFLPCYVKAPSLCAAGTDVQDKSLFLKAHRGRRVLLFNFLSKGGHEVSTLCSFWVVPLSEALTAQATLSSSSFSFHK